MCNAAWTQHVWWRDSELPLFLKLVHECITNVVFIRRAVAVMQGFAETGSLRRGLVGGRVSMYRSRKCEGKK
jgi:hypothetical protein